MARFARPFLIGALAFSNAQANAQAGAVPPLANQPPSSVARDVCATLEQAATENGLPVEFFVRVIWQESRFDTIAVSRKGAQGIAQFMPSTAD
jgi:soluble lytic murein transglycosylase-like protein